MRHFSLFFSVVLGLLISSAAFADAPAQTDPAAIKPADAAAPSAADVQKKMLEQMKQNESSDTIEPTNRPMEKAVPAAVGVDPTVQVGSTKTVAGTAPKLAGSVGAARPGATLVRDGQFIISRRGRIVVGSGGARNVFAFDADSEATPEPPMVLLPCQMLQNMEDIVAERGDQVVFILSGQVYAYRGTNYLLPTMMKLAIDKGNLQP